MGGGYAAVLMARLLLRACPCSVPSISLPMLASSQEEERVGVLQLCTPACCTPMTSARDRGRGLRARGGKNSMGRAGRCRQLHGPGEALG